MKNSAEKKWFVLYTKPRYEKKVYQQILEKKIESFFPTQIVIKKWSDRRKKMEVPLFPSYIFIHTNEKDRLYALETTGVIKCLTFKNNLATVRDSEIENIKRLLEYGKPLEVQNSIAIGSKVKIISGPLTGIVGVLCDIKGGKRFTISIEALSSNISVELPIDYFELAKESI